MNNQRNTPTPQEQLTPVPTLNTLPIFEADESVTPFTDQQPEEKHPEVVLELEPWPDWLDPTIDGAAWAALAAILGPVPDQEDLEIPDGPTGVMSRTLAVEQQDNIPFPLYWGGSPYSHPGPCNNTELGIGGCTMGCWKYSCPGCGLGTNRLYGPPTCGNCNY